MVPKAEFVDLVPIFNLLVGYTNTENNGVKNNLVS